MTPDKLLELTQNATTNIQDILTNCIKFDPNSSSKALVVFDTENGLTDIITQGYRNALPNANFVDFSTLTKESALEEFANMNPKDLVVLIQTGNFRLDDFRIRLHLFDQKLRVIEHMHLYRNNEDVWDVYIDSLAYDTNWYPVIGKKLSQKLADTKTLQIKSKEAILEVQNGLEIPKPNLGDYTLMGNVGGTFPIGEVFTEAKSFEDMNGSVYIYAFADKEFNISMHTPFRIDIERGIVVGYGDNTPQMFVDVWNTVKESERALIREIGFGLNRAMTKERYLGDITAFERILGLHLSMGEKHSVYKKEGITAKKSRFHVDLFLASDQVLSDGEVIFENGEYNL
jgi:aminopeptidase